MCDTDKKDRFSTIGLIIIFIGLVISLLASINMYDKYTKGTVFGPSLPSNIHALSNWSTFDLARLYGRFDCTMNSLMKKTEQVHYKGWSETCKTIAFYKDEATAREREEYINEIYRKLRK